MTPVRVFDLSDTHGMPFDVLGVMLREKGLAPDWEDFMSKAIDRRWIPRRIWRSAEELARPLGFWEQDEFQAKLKMMFIRCMKARGSETP